MSEEEEGEVGIIGRGESNLFGGMDLSDLVKSTLETSRSNTLGQNSPDSETISSEGSSNVMDQPYMVEDLDLTDYGIDLSSSTYLGSSTDGEEEKYEEEEQGGVLTEYMNQLEELKEEYDNVVNEKETLEESVSEERKKSLNTLKEYKSKLSKISDKVISTRRKNKDLKKKYRYLWMKVQKSKVKVEEQTDGGLGRTPSSSDLSGDERVKELEDALEAKNLEFEKLSIEYKSREQNLINSMKNALEKETTPLKNAVFKLHEMKKNLSLELEECKNKMRQMEAQKGLEKSDEVSGLEQLSAKNKKYVAAIFTMNDQMVILQEKVSQLQAEHGEKDRDILALVAKIAEIEEMNNFGSGKKNKKNKKKKSKSGDNQQKEVIKTLNNRFRALESQHKKQGEEFEKYRKEMKKLMKDNRIENQKQTVFIEKKVEVIHKMKKEKQKLVGSIRSMKLKMRKDIRKVEEVWKKRVEKAREKERKEAEKKIKALEKKLLKGLKNQKNSGNHPDNQFAELTRENCEVIFSKDFQEFFDTEESNVFETHQDLDMFCAEIREKCYDIENVFSEEWKRMKMLDEAFWNKYIQNPKESKFHPNHKEGYVCDGKYESYEQLKGEKLKCPFKDIRAITRY